MMPPGFEVLASIAAAICLMLAVVWSLAPQRLLSLWGIAYSQPAGLVSRRGAALFLGIGVMFFLARSAEPSVARFALSAGFAAGCLALSALGILELVGKRAGIGILSAVLVEVALAVAFLFQLFK